MTAPFSYSTTFILDKAHFNECFTNSVVPQPPMVAYRKAMILLVFGMLLVLFTEISGYISYFIFGLGIIEALGTYYQQPWWVTRQVWSKAGNNKVTLTIDESGIRSHSLYVDSRILWQDINGMEETKDGIILVHSKGKSYISNLNLSDQAKAYMSEKLARTPADDH